MSASNQTRPLSNIAHDIKRDWKPVNYAAVPYLAAMLQMDKITDAYMYDDGIIYGMWVTFKGIDVTGILSLDQYNDLEMECYANERKLEKERSES
jgi:hypothetical protein